ncbi:hypothetical protein Tsubulata_004001 [Turnera subulata]|uniref:Uncharacterized protein n=1 Tax=Turnera subulata TaxID=218843 RepID=A0A9Q0JA81_9ROSI|nr:hypothetical protein Tsubulata_004001 [Turnera subulata]
MQSCSTQSGAFSLVAVVRWSHSKGELSETRAAAHYPGLVPTLLSRLRNQFPPFPSLPALLAFLAVLMSLVGHYGGRTTHHAGVVTSLALDGTFLELKSSLDDLWFSRNVVLLARKEQPDL